MLLIISVIWSLLILLFVWFTFNKKSNKKVKKTLSILSAWIKTNKSGLNLLKNLNKVRFYLWKPSFKKNQYTSYLIRYTKWF